MKRSYPYTGPAKPGSGPTQSGKYGQPPPPAGPAPPLPAGTAYSNYGYGSVNTSRPNLPAGGPSMTHAGPQHHPSPQQQQQQWQAPPQQQQWNQYYAQQPALAGNQPAHQAQGRGAPPTHTSPNPGQPQAYQPPPPQQYQHQHQLPHQNQQSAQPTYYGYPPQTAGPAPPAGPAFGNYSPAAHQPVGPYGTYTGAPTPAPNQAASPQVGPPSKKARYNSQGSGGPNLGAGPVQPFPNPAGGVAAPLPPIGWQGSAPMQHPIPAMPPSVTPSAPGRPAMPGPAQNRNRGAGAASAGSGRHGPQVASHQRGNLPPVPKTQGMPPMGGRNARANQPAAAAMARNGPLSNQNNRRASSSGSVSSDKKSGARGATNHGNSNQNTSSNKPGFSSQNMIPINAPRGPGGARGAVGSKVAVTAAAASLPRPPKPAAASTAASKNVSRARQETPAGAKDARSVTSTEEAVPANSRRAHTDFRIRAIEIKELGWAWAPASSSVKMENGLADGDEVRSAPAEHDSDDEQQDTVGNGENDGEVTTKEETSKDDAVRPEEETLALDHSAAASADPSIEQQAEQVEQAEEKLGDVSNVETVPDSDVGGAEDIVMSQTKTETENENEHDGEMAESTEPPSKASTPAPNLEPPKGPRAEIEGKEAKPNRSRGLNTERDSGRLRIFFASMPNSGPEGAPTGPKAQQTKASLPAQPASDAKKDVDAVLSTVKVEPVDVSEVKQSASESQASANPSAAEESVDTSVPVKQEVDDADPQLPSQKASENGVDPEQHEAAEKMTEEQEKMVESEASQLDPDTKAEAQPVIDVSASQVEAKKEDDQSEREDKSLSSKPSDTEKRPKEKTDSIASASGGVKGVPQLSLNRVYITYAGARKRLGIDAEVIRSLRIFRSENRIEIVVNLSSDSPSSSSQKNGPALSVSEGVLLESRDQDQTNYAALSRSDVEKMWTSSDEQPIASSALEVGAARQEKSDESADAEVKLQDSNENVVALATTSSLASVSSFEAAPFFRLTGSDATQLTIVVHLDSSSPLVEPAWVKQGDVNELLANLQRVSGKSSALALQSHSWSGKIEVVDPDPPPSMESFLEDWIKDSFIGGQKERRKFVEEFLQKQNKTKKVAAGTESGAPSSQKEGADMQQQGVESQQGGTNSTDACSEIEVESNRERDTRICRGYIEFATRLIRGERAVLSPSSDLSSSLSSTSFTTSTTWPGAAMLLILDMALETPNADAAALRAKVGTMLMEFPKATLFRAVDLTWKDVVERQRLVDGNSGKKNLPNHQHQQQSQQRSSGMGMHTSHSHSHSHRHLSQGGGGHNHHNRAFGKRKRG